MFPNIELARSLRDQIRDNGSVLTWATHETSALKDIAQQLRRYCPEDISQAEWLLAVTRSEDIRILDLNRITLEHCFHPAIKRKTSLKAVLPAIWNSNHELHRIL